MKKRSLIPETKVKNPEPKKKYGRHPTTAHKLFGLLWQTELPLKKYRKKQVKMNLK